MTGIRRFEECDLQGHVYDEDGELVKTIKRPIADILNEFHERLLALEGRVEMDDSYKREQRER